MTHTPCHWLTTYTCMCMRAGTVFPEWCYLWLGLFFFFVCVWGRGTEMLLWYSVQQSAFIALITDFQRETTESLAFYAVPYMCVVCNTLCYHLHSQTRTSHSNSDALPILRTLSNFSGFMLSFLSNAVVLSKLLLAVKQNNSKFSDLKLALSTRIHFVLRTNLIIFPYLAKPKIT